MAESPQESVPLRQVLGALALDLPRTLWALRSARRHDRAAPWIGLRNRRERLLPAPAGRHGVACDWRWTSDLHVAHVFPALGGRMLRQALLAWPIGFGAEPGLPGLVPRASFVIGHRGLARQRQLLLTLASLAAQEGVAIECVVVEQSATPEVRDHLPPWVRYQHTPVDDATPYNRAWALNVGARLARGSLLVFHDSDMLAPRRYAAELCAQQDAGYEVVNLKRLVFYLGEGESEAVLKSEEINSQLRPTHVVQNLEAGGSLAISKATLEEIGALDEGFSGWGGEDNEFWERATTRRLWPWGYMPLVHLWHEPQREKGQAGGAPSVRRYEALLKVSPEERIARLRGLTWGQVSGPQEAHT